MMLHGERSNFLIIRLKSTISPGELRDNHSLALE